MTDLSSLALPGLAGFAAVSLAITFSQGPSTIAMTAAGSAFGPGLCPAPMPWGRALGTISVMAAVAAGLASLLLAEPAVATILLIISEPAIPLYLALRITHRPAPCMPQAGSRPAGWLLVVTNTKA